MIEKGAPGMSYMGHIGPVLNLGKGDSLVSVVIPALRNIDALVIALANATINQTVLDGNPPGPPTRQLPLQRLGLAQARKRSSQRVIEDDIDPIDHVGVIVLPI
jgi:hypothetical protein